MRTMVALLAVAALAAPAAAVQVLDYGWEDGATIAGQYGDIIATNVTAPDPVHSGARSLKLVDDQSSGTPQAYVAYIDGLSDGDVVTAGFWQYDVTPGGSPSARVWGHYVDGDINSYAGSASGNYDYAPGTGWSYVDFTWTFDSDFGSRDGLVIEARTYSNPGDTVWIDDLHIEAPDNATIVFPVPEPATLTFLALGSLALVRRRR